VISKICPLLISGYLKGCMKIKTVEDETFMLGGYNKKRAKTLD
jgi:hypothetical protein